MGWVTTVDRRVVDDWGTFTFVKTVEVATDGPMETEVAGELKRMRMLDVDTDTEDVGKTCRDVVQSGEGLAELWTTPEV